MNNYSYWFIILFICIACTSSHKEESTLELNTINWKIYRNKNIGFELIFPAMFAYDVQDKGHNVFFSYKDEVTLILRYVTKEEGNQMGLWFGKKAIDTISINEIDWVKYKYKQKSIAGSVTSTAYVIPLNDRFFGIEFRTDVADEAFQHFILQSVKLMEPEAPRQILIK